MKGKLYTNSRSLAVLSASQCLHDLVYVSFVPFFLYYNGSSLYSSFKSFDAKFIVI
jgi:hypothetical protein